MRELIKCETRFHNTQKRYVKIQAEQKFFLTCDINLQTFFGSFNTTSK